MLAMLLVTGLLVGACVLLGQALLLLCGWSDWKWWSPALGLCVLLTVFGPVAHFPHHQRALLAIAIGLVVVAAIVLLLRRPTGARLLEASLLGLLLLLLAAIPFFAYGYAGILGPSVSNDMSQHLTAVYWLRDMTGMLPVAAIGGDLINTGYPLGPHSLAAGLARLFGVGEVRAFSAITLAVPVLTGFAAIGLIPDARRGARWAFALVIGLGYLPVAYLAQGSFKETILAMIVLGTVVALGDLGPSRGRIPLRHGVPLGVFLSGAIYTYSYGAALWVVGAVAFFLAADVFRRRELFAMVRDWWLALGAAVVAAAILIGPEVDRIRAFRKSIFGQESLRNKGNLSHSLNPLETLGVWFNGDFRFNPQPRWPTTLFCILALAALVVGLRWWWRRRALAVPAAIVAAILVWASLSLTVNIYNAAKGLVVLAPLVMACVGAPLAMAWSTSGRGIRLARVLGVVLFAGAVVSSFGVLRSTYVGLEGHDAEFARIRPLVRHHATLFLDNDHFGEWELRGAKPLFTTNALYAPAHLGMRPEKNGGNPIDVDNYGRGELNKLDYIVVANARYRSEIPPNFKLALRTRSYDVFKRAGRTPTRFPLEPLGQPGQILDCTTPEAKGYLRRFKWAGVLPAPFTTNGWKGSIARPGGRATLRMRLPRGRWDVSLQYLSSVPVTITGPGLKHTLATNYGLIWTYWDAGTLTSDGKPFTLTARAAQRNWFARLLGTPRAFRAATAPGNVPLQVAAFTRHGATPKRIPAAQACGRYVDWFAPAGSQMRGRSDTA